MHIIVRFFCHLVIHERGGGNCVFKDLIRKCALDALLMFCCSFLIHHLERVVFDVTTLVDGTAVESKVASAVEEATCLYCLNFMNFRSCCLNFG